MTQEARSAAMVCISCGKPVKGEWCPEPCHTDLRDLNNRVESAAYGFYVYVIAFDQEQFGIHATKEAAEEALAGQIAEGGPAWEDCKVERWLVAGEPEIAS